jgi:hypothetical protein
VQAETRTLTQLFALDVRYLVPLYQRPYVWTEERQWAPLWEDIATVANHMLADDGGAHPPTHFLGAIVIQQQENPPGTPQRFMVIDGQQRLTTLQLLLSAAAVTADELQSGKEAQLLRKLTSNDPLLAEGEERFKVWPTNANRHAFRIVMDAAGEAATDDPTNQIQEAHHYFRTEIRDWATEHADEEEIGRRLAKLRISLSELLKLVAIRLEDGDSPQVIFETLNARGTPLIALDLLKNAVFLAAEHQGANTDDLYRAHWQPELDRDYWRTERRAGRLFTKNGDLFLAYWLVAELAEPVPATELFETFRDKVLQPADAPSDARADSGALYGRGDRPGVRRCRSRHARATILRSARPPRHDNLDAARAHPAPREGADDRSEAPGTRNPRELPHPTHGVRLDDQELQPPRR